MIAIKARFIWAVVTSLFLATLAPIYAQAETTEWTRQLGTSFDERSYGVSADGMGGVYITGFTQGSLAAQNNDDYDAFVSKYGSGGNLQWTRQLGTARHDVSYGVSADGLGSVYISGLTYGSLGGPSAGDSDAFVSKYDAAGNLAWTRQFGTAFFDVNYGVSADRLGNVYVTGWSVGSLGSWDAFISKLDTHGVVTWTRQMGSDSRARPSSVSADGLGNVYISGITHGNLDGPNAGFEDAFVRKFDAAGNIVWTRQWGTNTGDVSRAVSADKLGNVFISGSIGESVGVIPRTFVWKYDSAGNLKWSQIGSAGGSYGVSADGVGGVYISGWDLGSFYSPDAFVSRYDASGNLVWSQRLGTHSTEISRGVSADGIGNLYILGDTNGSFGGPNSSDRYDAFLTKISDVIIPEPPSSALTLLASLLLQFSRRRQGGRKRCQYE
jgi:hypothetical protein